MTKDDIIKVIRAQAKANGGEPFGQNRFFAEAGVTRHVMRKAGFANYGSARVAAGFARGELTQRFADDELFAPLARLTRELGHFPTEGEIEVARYSGKASIPSVHAFRSAAKRAPLRDQLSTWCESHREFADVAELLTTSAQRAPKARTRAEKVVTGYVYLMRYGATGKDYKIGCTENVARRESQIDMMSPTDVRRVHVIETDDPQGIERYWMERFSDRRVKSKEIFRLTADDVAAFKRRKYQ